jgi:hypothetical protein
MQRGSDHRVAGNGDSETMMYFKLRGNASATAELRIIELLCMIRKADTTYALAKNCH